MTGRSFRLSPRAEIAAAAAGGAALAVVIEASVRGASPEQSLLGVAGFGFALYCRPLTKRGAAIIGFGAVAALIIIAPAILVLLRF